LRDGRGTWRFQGRNMSKEDSHGGHGAAATTATMDAPTPPPSGRLLDIPSPRINTLSLPESLSWFESAIGGSLVAGSTILLSGPPGASKSTFATDLCLGLAVRGIKTLSILTEESPRRLLDRAVRLSSDWPKETVQAAIANMHVDASVLDLYNLPPFLAMHVLAPGARPAGCRAIILDSVQADGISSSSHRAYARLFEFSRLAKLAGVVVVMIAHQTKAGRIAGPNGFQHHVDQIILLRKALDARLMFVPKNRYGREVVRGIPLELDAVSGGLRPSRYTEPIAGVARVFLGGGCGSAEIQALIALPACNARAQVHAQGLSRRRVEQLLGCVARVPGLDLADLDVSINCMLPDDSVFRAPQGLGLCMAIVSTLLRSPIAESNLFVGEVDLRRMVRAPRPALIAELAAAAQSGELGSPLRIVCPPSVASALENAGASAEVVKTESLDDAIRMTWTSIR
jgi:predicted ATP-dependent serine protease